MPRANEGVILAMLLALTVRAGPARAQESKAAAATPPSQADILVALSAATAAWDKSCKHSDSDGFCASHKTVSDPRWCGASYDKVVVRRKAKSARRAEVALGQALAAFDSALPAVQQGLEGDAAAARMRVADAAAEGVLALPFPTNLCFDANNAKVMKASLKRFRRWLNDIQGAFKEAQAGYLAVAKLAGAGPLATTARQRVAAIALVFAATLEHAHMPKDVRSPPYKDDKMQAYCDELAAQAAPLRDLARRAVAP